MTYKWYDDDYGDEEVNNVNNNVLDNMKIMSFYEQIRCMIQQLWCLMLAGGYVNIATVPIKVWFWYIDWNLGLFQIKFWITECQNYFDYNTDIIGTFFLLSVLHVWLWDTYSTIFHSFIEKGSRLNLWLWKTFRLSAPGMYKIRGFLWFACLYWYWYM